MTMGSRKFQMSMVSLTEQHRMGAIDKTITITHLLLFYYCSSSSVRDVLTTAFATTTVTTPTTPPPTTVTTGEVKGSSTLTTQRTLASQTGQFGCDPMKLKSSGPNLVFSHQIGL